MPTPPTQDRHAAHEHLGSLTRNGAFGFAFEGIDDPALQEAGKGWPVVHLGQEIGEPTGPENEFHRDHVVFRIPSGGLLRLDRRSHRATLTTLTRPTRAEVMHPVLGLVAATFAHWRGWRVFHAGGIVLDGGAWALCGDRMLGKSTLLVQLARAGVGVVTDDILVVAGETVFPGPRFVDLRLDAASFNGVLDLPSNVAHQVRGDRYRYFLADVASELPLRGWVFLNWDDRMEIERVKPRELLTMLPMHRTVVADPFDPLAALDLSQLPAWRLRRPRRWDCSSQIQEILVTALTS